MQGSNWEEVSQCWIRANRLLRKCASKGQGPCREELGSSGYFSWRHNSAMKSMLPQAPHKRFLPLQAYRAVALPEASRVEGRSIRLPDRSLWLGALWTACHVLSQGFDFVYTKREKAVKHWNFWYFTFQEEPLWAFKNSVSKYVSSSFYLQNTVLNCCSFTGLLYLRCTHEIIYKQHTYVYISNEYRHL